MAFESQEEAIFLTMVFLACLYISYIDGKKTGEKICVELHKQNIKEEIILMTCRCLLVFLKFWSRESVLLGALNGKDDLL